MTTLHKKITFAFATLVSLISLLTLLAILDLLYLEKRVEESMVASNLENLIQEMRREEKNLFLYKADQARQVASDLAGKSIQLLVEQKKTIIAESSPAELKKLLSALQSYKQLLREYTFDAADVLQLEQKIRNQGHIASKSSAEIFSNVRQSLKQTIIKARWAQLISVVILVALMLLVGRLLARSVVSPLKRLIGDLKPIAEGRFDRLEPHSRHADLVTLRIAFNRMMDELEARRRRLIQSEKLAALGVLVSGVAHELNNPLSNISSSCQLLLEELDTADREQLQDWAQTIDSETERSKQIVAALLDFGRRREPDLVDTPLADLLDRTLLLLRGQLRKNGATVEQNVEDDIVLAADPQRLQQVFINLIRNAADSGDNLTIQITATVKHVTEIEFLKSETVVGEPRCVSQSGTRLVEMIVEDNGPGIPQDSLPRIFEPFYTTREPGHGMGLGLYIVQEIIQEHNGCIAASSVPQQGTRFIIRLPYGGNKA